MATQYKSAYMLGPKNLQLKEVDLPTIKDDQALVKVEAAGICGSDVECFEGNSGEGRYDIAPYTPGHEWSGEIVKVGSKVEEFKPLSLNEMTFKGTITGPSVGKYQGLTSKAAKFINTNKKLPNQTSMVTYINALKKGGISNGELRLLNLTDEFGDVHPKLLDEIQSSNPLDKITRQRLARYIKENRY